MIDTLVIDTGVSTRFDLNEDDHQLEELTVEKITKEDDINP